jgi:cobalt-zinc-cadmium efflux system outer membrane protein
MYVRQTARVCYGILAWFFISPLWGESATSVSGAAPQGALTRVEALRLAETHSARLAAAACGVDAAEGRALQAGLRLNPEVEVEVEDVAGTAGSSVFGDSVSTARVGQRLEVGGKRAARRRLAEVETELGRWDVRQLQQDLRHDTARAFTAVLAGQERLRLVQEACDLAQRLAETVSERVQAGKDAPLELSKAKVAAASRRIELRRAEGALQTARVVLAAQWGADAPTFSHAAGELAAIPATPALDSLLAALAANPDLARWPTETAQRAAALDVARAGRMPDVSLAAGAAWSAVDDGATFLLSVSVPLQLFDRNQGAIREANANLRQAAAERRALETELRAALVAVHQDFSTVQQEILSLAGELLPEAGKAMEAAREAYAQGKTGYLEVLDAQQTLFAAQMQYVEALATCHDALAAAERLTGLTLNR